MRRVRFWIFWVYFRWVTFSRWLTARRCAMPVPPNRGWQCMSMKQSAPLYNYVRGYKC
jgi:hypothetical protein